MQRPGNRLRSKITAHCSEDDGMKTAARRQEHETFRFLVHTFDITALRQLVARGSVPFERTDAPVNSCAEHHGLPRYQHREDGTWGHAPLLATHIDMPYAESLPCALLDEPLLFVLVPGPDRPYALQVDGHHRLAKAWLLGLDTLPAILVMPKGPQDTRAFYRRPNRVPHLFARPRKGR